MKDYTYNSLTGAYYYKAPNWLYIKSVGWQLNINLNIFKLWIAEVEPTKDLEAMVDRPMTITMTTTAIIISSLKGEGTKVVKEMAGNSSKARTNNKEAAIRDLLKASSRGWGTSSSKDLAVTAEWEETNSSSISSLISSNNSSSSILSKTTSNKTLEVWALQDMASNSLEGREVYLSQAKEETKEVIKCKDQGS